jgi:hypothetical protein|tara:strand:+ start:122 stop:412 length:291 start_codon:yes stop_codon:yes gene_type:complete
MQYDPKVIEAFAEAMYKEADRIAVSSAILWGLGAAVLIGVATTMLESASLFMVVVGGGGAGFLGYKRGEAKAFTLKLEAQTALCQVQIERNAKGDL